MKKIACLFLPLLAFLLLSANAFAASASAVVTVKNPIDVARPSETIVLKAADLRKLLAVDDVRKVHVRDDKTGKDLLTQAVDLDDDATFDELLFQADLASNETRTFTLTVGARPDLKPLDFKAYGRFVQERRDDFAWENDRIAHRMYGAALETWPHEPLVSSSVDVWTKKVRRLVINDWYMVDDYHQDHGEGADFYSAGSTRGCGGDGIWANGALYPSANFRGSKLIANGPIRVMFELTYPQWDAGGIKVGEVKRITLDAGQNLDRFESFFKFDGGANVQYAAGIRKTKDTVKTYDSASGTLRTWEPLKEGELGIGVIVDPATIVTTAEDKSNYLVVAKLPQDGHVSYYAGFGWDKSGDFANVGEWDKYLAQWARRLRAPVEVTLTAK
jgi:hypothetical protein